ncbi:MAG: BON domain-containing protein [Bacteroidota bacterium]
MANVNLDVDLKQNVIDELMWEPAVDSSKIDVTVEDGTVILNGTVPTYYEKFNAEEAALRVIGVTTVVNDISVEIAAAFERSDADIAQIAKNVLIWDTTVPEDRVTVEVDNGWITLNGIVEWNYQKANAANDVSYLAGVRGITNNITVEPTAQLDRPAEKIRTAFERSALLNVGRIDISIDGAKATLSGTVPTWTEKRQAERIAWSTPGVYTVENNIIVAP